MDANSTCGVGQYWPKVRLTVWPRQDDETIKAMAMKFCYACGKLSAGEPLFCTKCGRSYDVRLCPRLHRNSRWAKACSQCGSHELSQPQPHVSLWWKALELLIRAGGGLFLLYVALLVLVDLVRRPEFQAGIIVVGVLLGLLVWLWRQLPEWFRKFVSRCMKRKEHEGER